MTLALLLFLKSISALLAALAGTLRRATLFLLSSIAGDLLRQLFAGLREGHEKPYTGVGFLLWLPDVAGDLAPACVLLGALYGRRKALAVWGAAFLTVAVSYPSLRGDALLAFYWTIYAVIYIVTVARLLWKSFSEKMTKDEALLLLIALAGIGDLVLLKMFRMENWWGVWAINGAAYLSALVIAVFELRLKGKVTIHRGDEAKDLRVDVG